jgi:hypothetical protein
VTEVFKFAKPAHTQCPLGSRSTGVETVDGFGVGTTLAALLCFRTRTPPAVKSALGLTLCGWGSALELGAL